MIGSPAGGFMLRAIGRHSTHPWACVRWADKVADQAVEEMADQAAEAMADQAAEGMADNPARRPLPMPVDGRMRDPAQGATER